MRISHTVFLLITFCLRPTMHGETLAEVLSAHSVPTSGFAQSDLQQSIKNKYVVSAGNSHFLLAYSITSKSRTPSPSLGVLRYDRQTKLLQQTILHGVERSFTEQPGALKQVTTECLGAMLTIEEYGGFIEIGTHITPSAGCTLLLKPDMTFVAELLGWEQAKVDKGLLLQESTVHFAPTHPLRLEVYDLPSGTLNSIYPAQRDARRERFSLKLQEHMPSDAWCMAENRPCDPKEFSASVDHVSVEKTGLSFTFDVVMEPEGFGPQAEKAVHPETVHYVCRKRDGRWVLGDD